MDEQWTGIVEGIRSSDPNQVNDAIENLKGMDRDERAQAFDEGFADLTAIYDESSDGYVRQSAVRAVKPFIPGLVAGFLIAEEDQPDTETAERLHQRVDAIRDFLLETIHDEDGRVRQSTKRGLNDVYRSYDAFEDHDAIAEITREIGEQATEATGKHREHLLETKEDAEFFLQSDEKRVWDGLERLSEEFLSSAAPPDVFQPQNPPLDDEQMSSIALPEPLDSVLPVTAVPIHELRALEERDEIEHVVILLPIETGFGVVTERFMIQYDDAGYILENVPQQGWDVIEQVDGSGKSERELLAALASAAREWHEEVAEIVRMTSGQRIDSTGIEAMNETLNQELERKGYPEL